jgi:ubiquinone/menaquinone biosynthesis C-methylase UbiE
MRIVATSQMAEPTLGRRRLAWTRYWAEGDLHSLGTSFPGNYADSIGTYWQAEFAVCKTGAQILDIGCGNGPLAKLLVDLDPSSGPSLTGIDLANPTPRWLSQQSDSVKARIQFHGGVAAEKLPFPDNAFDLIVSQFGIEYSELETSQAEVVRVLKLDGRIALLIHHSESLPVVASKHELRHLSFLEQIGFLNIVEKMIPYMSKLAALQKARALNDDPSAKETRCLFDEAEALIEKRSHTEPIPDLLVDTRICARECFRLAAQAGVQPAIARLSQYRTFLRDSEIRLAELIKSAQDEKGVQRIQARFSALREKPVQISPTPLLVNDHIFGWVLRA